MSDLTAVLILLGWPIASGLIALGVVFAAFKAACAVERSGRVGP